MKSSYRQNNSRRSSRVLAVATVVVICILVIDALSHGGVRSLVRASGTLVWSLGSQGASAVSTGGFFSSRKALIEENEELKSEVERLSRRLAELASLEAENTSLRALTRLAEDLAGVAAPITSSLRASPYGTFTIGAGRAQGIAVGDAVVAGTSGKGFVIGRVSEVSERSALVVRTFSPETSIESLVRDVPITAQGWGGGNARAEAPRALLLEEGDIVTAPSMRGLPVGVVANVSSDAASAYQSVYIGLPFSLSGLSFVYVVSLDS